MSLATPEEVRAEIHSDGDRLGTELFDAAMAIIRSQTKPLCDTTIIYALCQASSCLLAAAAAASDFITTDSERDAYKFRVLLHIASALDEMMEQDGDEDEALEVAATNAPPGRLQ